MNRDHHDLEQIARRAMIERHLEPDFPPDALRELRDIDRAADEAGADIRDMRHMLWCSIDNDDSRDIDQITFAAELASGAVAVYVGIADVDALVLPRTAIDRHAQVNTTSVYTPARIFSMLPEKLSTNLTSLSENEERLAIVIEMAVGADGLTQSADIYRALVRNRAQLAYNSVAAGLESNDTGSMPVKVRAVTGLDEQLRLQDRVAQRLKQVRHLHGALEFETIEPRTVMDNDRIVNLVHEPKNRAHELIEDFMVSANGAVANFLDAHGYPSLRRVVRSPERWARIADVAESYDWELPHDPDSVALAKFLSARRNSDPLRFPDLSLTIIKLMGRGEYAVETPGSESIGHFGLAVSNYSHSTAPNRRYPDLATQRLIKSALAGGKIPYSLTTLQDLAAHCTRQEDAAEKVERKVRKSAAALLLSDHIGKRFDAIVTGASPRGTWVRALSPPVEGRVVEGFRGLDVGDRISVKLIAADVERGFIDFSAASG